MAPRKNPSKTPKSYSDGDKAEALALYVEKGPREASRQTGIPVRTITRWAAARGLSTEVETKTAAATAAAREKAALLREQLRHKLLEKAVDILDRMDAPHKDFKVVGVGDHISEVTEVWYDKPTPSGVKDYAIAVGVLIDKLRLENGETTDNRNTNVSGGLTMSLRGVPDDQLDAGLARLLGAADQG